MLCYAYIYTCYLHSMQKSSCLVQLILWMKCRQDSQSRSPGWSFDGRIGRIKFTANQVYKLVHFIREITNSQLIRAQDETKSKEEKVVRTKNPPCCLLPQLWDFKRKVSEVQYFRQDEELTCNNASRDVMIQGTTGDLEHLKDYKDWEIQNICTANKHQVIAK